MSTATATAPAPFVFNKDYDDHEQVRHLMPEYAAVRAELDAAGEYPYNASFKGRLASLATTDYKNEDTAIYMLQTMHRRDADTAKQDAFTAAGGYDATTIPVGEVRRGTVASFGWYSGGTGWGTTEDARVTTDERGRVLVKRPGQRQWRVMSDAGSMLFKENAR